MNSADLKVLNKKRDMYVKALSYNSSSVSLDKDIMAAFNSEINMLQFIIENIDNPKTIEDNPYFYSWIRDTIKFHKASKSSELEMFLRLKNYIGHALS